jgi:hypothetical protein
VLAGYLAGHQKPCSSAVFAGISSKSGSSHKACASWKLIPCFSLLLSLLSESNLENHTKNKTKMDKEWKRDLNTGEVLWKGWGRSRGE